jgi:hypothetical protein
MTTKMEMDYTASTQTLVGSRQRELVDRETGEIINVQQITKRYYGEESFWKVYLFDFLAILGVFDSKQVDVFCHIVKNTNQSTNLFIGTYDKIMKDVGVSRATIASIMKKLQQNNFITKVQNGVWMVNPEIMMRGDQNKKQMLIRYFQSDDPLDEMTKPTTKPRTKKTDKQGFKVLEGNSEGKEGEEE